MKQGCSSDCYYAPKKLDDPQGAEKEEMKEALLSRDEIYDLAFTLPTQYFKIGDGVARLSVVSHIGLKDLRFRMADGRHYNELNVATVIFDDNGNYLTNGGKIVKLRLLDSAFEKWCSTGLTVKSGFELKPGKRHCGPRRQKPGHSVTSASVTTNVRP